MSFRRWISLFVAAGIVLAIVSRLPNLGDESVVSLSQVSALGPDIRGANDMKAAVHIAMFGHNHEGDDNDHVHDTFAASEAVYTEAPSFSGDRALRSSVRPLPSLVGPIEQPPKA